MRERETGIPEAYAQLGCLHPTDLSHVLAVADAELQDKGSCMAKLPSSYSCAALDIRR